MAGASVACSSAAELPPDGQEHARQDRVVIEAPSTTREAIGVSSWGIDDRADSTVVHGYDGEDAAIVTFAYRAASGEQATFDARLEAGTTHARMRLEAHDAAHLRVVEDSFRGSAAASAILARLVADLKTQPSAAKGTSLTAAAIRPLDIVDQAPVPLVDNCSAQLVPASANAGQTVTDCSNGAPGCSQGFGNATAGGNRCCSNAAATAYRYHERNTADLQQSGELPIDPGVSPSESCANFVTATLQQAGLIDWHANLVSDLESRLRAQGWTEVSASDAKPGDVAILGGASHAELVYGNDNGNVTLIGSNNANADGTQRVTLQPPYTSVRYLRAPASVCQ